VHGIIEPLILEVIDHDPRELGDRSTVWTTPLLAYYLEQQHHIKVSRKGVSLAIGRLELRWKRPRHDLARRPTTWSQAATLTVGFGRVAAWDP
jgi:transposase